MSPSITENAEGNFALGGGGSFQDALTTPLPLACCPSRVTSDDLRLCLAAGPRQYVICTRFWTRQSSITTIPTDQPLSLDYADNFTFGDVTEVFDGTLTGALTIWDLDREIGTSSSSSIAVSSTTILAREIYSWNGIQQRIGTRSTRSSLMGKCSEVARCLIM